jgi:hypothetical protein
VWKSKWAGHWISLSVSELVLALKSQVAKTPAFLDGEKFTK